MSHLWTDAAHHDGSVLYTGGPRGRDLALDDTVPLRVHVPGERSAVEEIHLRAVRDGEPEVTALRPESSDGSGTWWRADLRLHNPLTSYRFLLTGGRAGYRWLTAAGTRGRDVTDAGDFKISVEHSTPDWVADQVGYQIFPDRFARGGPEAPLPDWAVAASWEDPVIGSGPGVAEQLYGGTLDGIGTRLDHLESLGVTLLYLTPFFAARSNHRYDALSFSAVDPLLGGDEALGRLIDVASARGIRVIGDLTLNHTGDAHPWFRQATADPSSPSADAYYLNPDGSYAAWLDVPSLPKLDHASDAVADMLYRGQGSVVATWLRRGLAGWRIDVANMTGRLGAHDHAHTVARRARSTMEQVSPDAWLLAEHNHDASADLMGAGWHGTMDYSGFTRPMWAWLNGGGPGGPFERHGLTWMGLPVDVPRLSAAAAVGTMREVHASMPWVSWLSSTMHLDTHDTPRFRTVLGGGTDGAPSTRPDVRAVHEVAIAAQFTMPGVPVLFSGDEIGLTGVNGEHSRTPFPWDREDTWDLPTLAAYRRWAGRRHDLVALRRGSMRWLRVDEDSMTYLREHPDGTVLVHLVRASGDPVRLDLRPLGVTELSFVEGGGRLRSGLLELPGDGPAAHLATLGPPAR